ncbi:MAG: LysM peptidoglycan-binding domain-containing protein [Chitinophagales bacterium]|nr:LysM peptidoglycan-binding domain-containing protein [Chitinophagales bacterium]
MKLYFTFSLLFFGICTFAQTPSVTSVIAHKVEPNQTLYAIGRLYHVSPQVLMKNNPQYAPDFHLKTGNIVKVPTVEVKGTDVNAAPPIQTAPKPSNYSTSPATASSGATPIAPTKTINHQEKYAKFSTHIVRNGETIESIAEEEQVTAADLIALNKSKIDHLKPGDIIFVKEYWLPIESGPSASVQQINKEDVILSTIIKEKYDNELLFMNENR